MVEWTLGGVQATLPLKAGSATRADPAWSIQGWKTSKNGDYKTSLGLRAPCYISTSPAEVSLGLCPPRCSLQSNFAFFPC